MSTIKKQTNLPSWLDGKQKILNERRAKVMKEKGMAEFYTLPEGESKIFIDINKEPREQDGDFGLRTIFRINAEGKEYDLSCSDALARRIYNALTAGVNPMTVIRIGDGKQTRFSIKELKKKP